MPTSDERIAALEAAIGAKVKPKSRGSQSSEYRTALVALGAGAAALLSGVVLVIRGEDEEQKAIGKMLIQEGMPMLGLVSSIYIGGRSVTKAFKKEESSV